jgi:hypothetical protein
MNPTRNNDKGPSTRRYATIGVTGGLLAGGAIGLLVAAPAFTSAATDTTLPAVEESEPTETSGPARSGVRIREALESLVEDGTITAEQADAVADHLAAQLPARGDRPGRWLQRRPGFDGEVVAEIVGIDVSELREQLREGSSIADIATANGVDPQTVVDALVAEGQEHLDLAVENGRLTEEEAAEKTATLEERVTDRVNGERPARSERSGSQADPGAGS